MSKSFKSWVGITVALIMVMAMGITASAADSPTASGTVNKVVSATDADGCAVRLDVQPLPAKFQPWADELKEIDNLKSILGDAYVEGMEVIDVRDIVIIDVNGGSIEEHDGDLFPVTLTFEVPGVLSTTNVAVLHHPEDADAWHKESCKAGNGTITATFEGLSPVAFVVDKNTSSGSVAVSGTSGTKSPKTGENMAIPFVGTAAVVLLAGAAFCFRKKETR